jgi:hypothetical protein
MEITRLGEDELGSDPRALLSDTSNAAWHLCVLHPFLTECPFFPLAVLHARRCHRPLFIYVSFILPFSESLCSLPRIRHALLVPKVLPTALCSSVCASACGLRVIIMGSKLMYFIIITLRRPILHHA